MNASSPHYGLCAECAAGGSAVVALWHAIALDRLGSVGDCPGHATATGRSLAALVGERCRERPGIGNGDQPWRCRYAYGVWPFAEPLPGRAARALHLPFTSG